LRKKAAAAEPGNAPVPRRSSAEPLLTVVDVMRILHVSRGYVSTVVRSGELPSIRMGRMLRFRAGDLDRFIENSWTVPGDV
jgi:excisionase family DNA binding protein